MWSLGKIRRARRQAPCKVLYSTQHRKREKITSSSSLFRQEKERRFLFSLPSPLFLVLYMCEKVNPFLYPQVNGTGDRGEKKIFVSRAYVRAYI